MKIIQVHNYYKQAGGEDGVVEAEASLLRSRGHVVVPYYKDNEALGVKRWALVKASLQTLWNGATYREFRKVLQSENPDVVHCHNTFPLISPSIYWACAKEKVPVVQTLHNYRLLCLNAFLFREAKKGHEALGTRYEGHDFKTPRPKDQRPVPSPSGSVCELCVKKALKYSGIRFRCYRKSLAGSFVVAVMLFLHKLLGTWSRKVTAYIALTEFQKKKMVEGGLPAQKVFVKPNFIHDTDDDRQERCEKSMVSTVTSESEKPPYCLFVGRLSPEKGCEVLIRAWARFQQGWGAEHHAERTALSLASRDSASSVPRLLIIGDGPERSSLEMLAGSLLPNSQRLGSESICFLGRLPKERVLGYMRDAQFLVLPSIWYEGFPMTIVESFSCGLPVLASNDGGMRDTINDNKTGQLFPMGDDAALASKLAWAFEHPGDMAAMGLSARAEFEEMFSADVNYEMLMGIYRVAKSGV
jgi:glycosyltransferase involved in cell wall biosynthesis